MRRLMILILLGTSASASAGFVHANLTGPVRLGPTSPAPDSLSFSLGLSDYFAGPELPYIDPAELDRYRLRLTATLEPDTITDGAPTYWVEGALGRDDGLGQAIEPQRTAFAVDGAGVGGILLSLFFISPLSPDAPDFSATNGSYLGGTVTLTSESEGVFEGQFIDPLYDTVPEPATLALFGLGAIMLGRRRRA